MCEFSEHHYEASTRETFVFFLEISTRTPSWIPPRIPSAIVSGVSIRDLVEHLKKSSECCKTLSKKSLLNFPIEDPTEILLRILLVIYSFSENIHLDCTKKFFNDDYTILAVIV